MQKKSFHLLSMTALLLFISSASISVKQEPNTLQSQYSVGIGQPAMALGSGSWQYRYLAEDAGVCSNWADMVSRANANNQRRGINRRYGTLSIFNPLRWSRIVIGFTANF